MTVMELKRLDKSKEALSAERRVAAAARRLLSDASLSRAEGVRASDPSRPLYAAAERTRGVLFKRVEAFRALTDAGDGADYLSWSFFLFL
jgi:hypothetical protein